MSGAIRPVFRFAPSPNGVLHLGHAYSAWANATLAGRTVGRFLLRIEDIDETRSRPEHEKAILDDLAWLGFDWERPVRRQSEHFAFYESALQKLRDEELVYPAFMSRGEIRAFIAEAGRPGSPWPRDPDGAPLYPGLERSIGGKRRRDEMASGKPFAWRLDMQTAIARCGQDLTWLEDGSGPEDERGTIAAAPGAWGDVVIGRKEFPASYHLAVTLDDAAQGVTDIVRGRDLFHATAVHRLLQNLLGLPEPRYFHHRLVTGPDGRKLSKSLGDTGISSLRENGLSPEEVLDLAGCKCDPE